MMDSVYSICKGTIFLLSIFKETEYSNQMNTNKEIVSRLKFISKINKGEKINVRSAYPFIQPDDLVTKFSRTFYHKDNRSNALVFIRNTVYRSFEILDMCYKSTKDSDKVMCSNIIKDLKSAEEGINNLKETYLTDTMFCCDLDTIIQEVEVKLAKLKEKENVKTF